MDSIHHLAYGPMEMNRGKEEGGAHVFGENIW
jgi:hypothetical protein